jgi:hypothetical protein
MENIRKLKELTEREIGMIANHGDLNPELLENAMKAVCLMNAIEDYEMKEAGEFNSYSLDYGDDGMSRDRYYDGYSGARMRSRVTGRYMSSRDSRDMGSSNNMYRDNYRDSYRDGYSGHDKMDLIKDLEMKMHNANSDRERESIRDTIDIIKRQN